MESIAVFLGIARDSFFIALAFIAGEWLAAGFLLVLIWTNYRAIKLALEESKNPPPGGFLSSLSGTYRRAFTLSMYFVPTFICLISFALIAYEVFWQ